VMLVGELILELQKYPANIEVTIYVGKCCDVQPIHRVHFQANECDGSPFVVLVDETTKFAFQVDAIALRVKCFAIKTHRYRLICYITGKARTEMNFGAWAAYRTVLIWGRLASNS